MDARDKFTDQQYREMNDMPSSRSSVPIGLARQVRIPHPWQEMPDRPGPLRMGGSSLARSSVPEAFGEPSSAHRATPGASAFVAPDRRAGIRKGRQSEPERAYSQPARYNSLSESSQFSQDSSHWVEEPVEIDLPIDTNAAKRDTDVGETNIFYERSDLRRQTSTSTSGTHTPPESDPLATSPTKGARKGKSRNSRVHRDNSLLIDEPRVRFQDQNLSSDSPFGDRRQRYEPIQNHPISWEEAQELRKRPTYPRALRQHLDAQTLHHFKIPYEYDRVRIASMIIASTITLTTC